MANPDISSVPILDPDPLNPNPMDAPPLDMEFLNNLVFDDGDFDVNFDELVFPTDGSDVLSSNVTDPDFGDWYVNDENYDSRVVPQDSGGGSSNEVCMALNNSPSPESGKVGEFGDIGCVLTPESAGPASSQGSGDCRSVVDGFLNSPSPESGAVSGSSSPLSSSNVQQQSDVVLDVEAKVEEEGKGGVLKRKKEDENTNVSNSNLKSSKFRKSAPSSDNVAPEEDKKKARLMRNRESAQLSRQRKKHYVEELEDKVRSMHTVISDLNNKISYIMAENASLRQQLSGGNCVPPQPGVYPSPTMAPMGYPWVPCPSYPVRTQGSQVPLVPIPRLKPRQPVSASKAKKSESKKSDSKVKKVSSVTFLGLLFFVLLFGGLVPLVNVKYGGKMEMGYSGFGFSTNGFHGQPHGRILTVSNNLNHSHQGVEVGYHSGKSNLRECGANRMNCKRIWVENEELKDKSNGFEHSGNSSEPLVASLYVPRNDKLVKIDGNLIIHSVLASERAMASCAKVKVKSDKSTVSSTNDSPRTSLAIAGDLAAAFSVPNGHVETHPHLYRSPSVRQKALSSGPRDGYKESPRSAASDGSLQKWFLEGLAGPVLSSGMCTEVFQFDVSPSANPGAIIPATSTVNVTAQNISEPNNPSKRNRRILNRLPARLSSEFNHTNNHTGTTPPQKSEFHKNKSVSQMVVSVLVDPREAGDRDVDGGISPKSLSRIFVVVLIDSVKYVTYSCMLPFKGSSSHLVTT